MSASAARVAARFLASTPKPLSRALQKDDAEFVDIFRLVAAVNYIFERRMNGVNDEPLTAKAMEEAAWELGYENEPYDRKLKRFEALARHLGTDLRAHYDRGAKDR